MSGIGCFQRAGKYLAPEQALISFRSPGHIQRLPHRQFRGTGHQFLSAGKTVDRLDAQSPLTIGLPGEHRHAFRLEAAGNVQHNRIAAGNRNVGFGSEGFFLGCGTGLAVQHPGALFNAAVRQGTDQLQLVHHLDRDIERVGSPQVNAVLADGAAVDIFQFP